MLGNVPKNLPKEEYQSFVASLHSDRKTMTIGTLAAIIASLATFFYDDDFNVLFFTVGFVLIGSIRFYFMTRFQRYFNKSDDAELPRKWEIFAIVGGLLMAICLGSWAFYTIQYSQSQFTVLVAISTCLSHMVGVAARNFGADILVTSQSLAIGLPIVSAMLLRGICGTHSLEPCSYRFSAAPDILLLPFAKYFFRYCDQTPESSIWPSMIF